MSESQTPAMNMTPPPVPDDLNQEISQGNPLFSKFKNLKRVLGGVLGVVLLAFAGYWVYANYFMPPERMIKEAFEKMDVDSIKLGFEAEAEGVTVSGMMIAHEEDFSQMDFKIGLEEEGVWHEFDLNFIVDIDDVYFQMNYSLMEAILSQADLMVPGISSTQTYALLKPVITGKSWLHMLVPAEDQVTTDPEEYAAEYEKFGEKLAAALVIKDFQKKVQVSGEKYNVISLGVEKEKLLEAIDELKNLDLSTEVSDINNFKKAIEDMGELKETLAVVYLDMDGYLRMVDLYAPQGTSESFQEVIEQESQAKSPLMAQLSQLTSYFQPDKGVKEGESVKFMTITFDDYGSAAKVVAPYPVVEWDQVLTYIESEMAPLMYQYMMMQQQTQPRMNQGTYPVNNGGVELPTYPPQTLPAGSVPGSNMPMNFMQLLQQ
ncbi:MAG: hypothetical protein ACOZAK_01195 [Patescibacteria group bacterium]